MEGIPAAFVLDDCSSDVVAKAAIAGGQKEAFYVFDMNETYHQILRFREVMPRVQILYAMKANDSDMLLKLAVAAGLGFDCASPGEIDKILRLNVSPMSIIYAFTSKTVEQMIYARESGLRHTTFDSSYELKKIKQYWPDARLLIRIRVDGDSTYKLGSKFGCDFDTEAIGLLEEAATFNLKVIGVAFHVGSACVSIQTYALGLQRAKSLFEHESRAGRCMRIVDIGGGFFNDSHHSLDDVSKVINSTLEELFPDPKVQVIAELGRYICETAFTLYSPIVDVRRLKKNNKVTNMIHLTEYTHDTVTFFEQWYHVENLKRCFSVEKPEDTIICGVTNRTHTIQVQLARCEPQDWLVFRKQGAYTMNFSKLLCQYDNAFIRSIISTKLWNKIKKSQVFSLTDFITSPKMIVAFPSILPPPCKLRQRDHYSFEVHTYFCTMNGTDQNAFQKYPCPGVFVLDNNKPKDVAAAMIENGEQKQPFYIFNMDEAYNRIQHFRTMMPRVQLFYAMKSNDTALMLKLAISLGVGFDCASPGEIYKIRQLNVNPKSIIYAMTTKTPEQMLYAREAGVQHTTFDTSYELKKLKKYWPEAKLLQRIRVESVSRIQLGDKFGCDYESEAVDLLEEAASLGLTVVGVAFHVGCVCSSLESYAVGIRQVKALFDHEAEAGRKMHIVDIGGGFASDRTDSIDKVSSLVNRSLEELFPDPEVQVIAEPGRYLSDSAFTLYCNTNNVRRIKKDGKQVSMVYLNDGVYGTMRYPESWHKLTKFMNNNETETGVLEETILWGPSCDSLDQVRKQLTNLLPRLSPHDWVVFEIHGSYTLTFSTRFSCLEIPLIRSVISLELWNKIKNRSIFNRCDFIINPDISAPLPMTLPPLVPKNNMFEHSQIPTLHI